MTSPKLAKHSCSPPHPSSTFNKSIIKGLNIISLDDYLTHWTKHYMDLLSDITTHTFFYTSPLLLPKISIDIPVQSMKNNIRHQSVLGYGTRRKIFFLTNACICNMYQHCMITFRTKEHFKRNDIDDLENCIEENHLNNNYDIADILIDHNITIRSDIINILHEENNLIFCNINYIIYSYIMTIKKKNYKKSQYNAHATNKSLISQWIKSTNNKFLEIYINYNYNIFEIKNKKYNEAIHNENYDGFIILLDNNNININDILGYIVTLISIN
ncbi:hypothetical protein H8356DRAFT_1436097 [Neocallimastix lanati (nom. inval.)]|nr:hypothetical protein H8356DRAFT_1436097 [Neocallimastix sp. JGI-2020a]